MEATIIPSKAICSTNIAKYSSFLEELYELDRQRQPDPSKPHEITAAKLGYSKRLIDIKVLIDNDAMRLYDPEDLIDKPLDDMYINLSFENNGNPMIITSSTVINYHDQLPFEDDIYYEHFKEYIARKNIEKGSYYRQLETSLENNLARVFKWKERAQAFDSQITDQLQQRKMSLQVEMVNKHQQTAHKLYNKCMNYFDENFEVLSPKDVIKITEMAIKLERESLGIMSEDGKLKQTPVVINVQNNMDGSTTNSVQMDNPQFNVSKNAESASDEAQRLAETLHVMNQMGILKETSSLELVEPDSIQQDNEPIEVSYKEVETIDENS